MLIIIVVLTAISLIFLLVVPAFYVYKIRKVDPTMYYIDAASKRMSYLIKTNISYIVGIISGVIALFLIYIN